MHGVLICASVWRPKKLQNWGNLAKLWPGWQIHCFLKYSCLSSTLDAWAVFCWMSNCKSVSVHHLCLRSWELRCWFHIAQVANFSMLNSVSVLFGQLLIRKWPICGVSLLPVGNFLSKFLPTLPLAPKPLILFFCQKRRLINITLFLDCPQDWGLKWEILSTISHQNYPPQLSCNCM